MTPHDGDEDLDGDVIAQTQEGRPTSGPPGGADKAPLGEPNKAGRSYGLIAKRPETWIINIQYIYIYPIYLKKL